ncbi:Protein kinase domain [Trypanosoma melophagium]|uniref:Protein kinase domain n=1 Tax=Trypanosoma melophagium TaxID=715481 RepID=UPI00351A7F9F|nr:Protein kinase domain [Trypanosoma melophagium]
MDENTKDIGSANNGALRVGTTTTGKTPATTTTATASSQSSRSMRPVSLLDGRYVLQQRIGSGAFGDLYQGHDTKRNMEVAVKLEKRKATCPQLSYESKVYSVLHRGAGRTVGIPQVYQYNTDGEYNILAMELCGPSLEDLFNYCGRRLSLKTVCMLADQILQRVEFVHTKGFIHRDIKPENFVFGLGKKGHILYLIDYGLSKQYWDKRKQMHIPFVVQKPVTGTARYCSTWTHLGFEQSRRDDMEAVGFILVYFLAGSLPWQGIPVRDLHAKTVQIGIKKNETPLEDLCAGLPEEVLYYCAYCRKLKFAEKPDYDFLRELFRRLAKRFHLLLTSLPSMPSIAEGSEMCGSACSYTNDGNNSAGIHSHSHNPLHINNQHQLMLGYDWMFDWFVKRAEELRLGGKRLDDNNNNNNNNNNINNKNNNNTASANVMINSGIHLVAMGGGDKLVTPPGDQQAVSRKA